MKNKKAAMQMSMGTIVTIILLVSVLILGIFLVQRIFGSATTAVDLTDQQLKNEINKLFSEDKRLVIYPGTRFIEAPQGENSGIGIGIKNLLKGDSSTKTFSYEVVVSDASDCPGEETTVSNWISLGRTESGLPIPVGDLSSQKVVLNVPEGTALCSARFRVNVFAEEAAYATDFFDVQVVA